jgi:hypothetical protein
MGKLARACAEAAIHGRRWRVPDPSCCRVPMAGAQSASRALSPCDVEHSLDDRHVIRVSILLFFKAAGTALCPFAFASARARRSASGQSPRGARLL